MGTNQHLKTKEQKKETAVERRDFYLIFLFAVQVYLFFTKSVANDISLTNIIASSSAIHFGIFLVYSFTFCILFMNFFYLFLCYRATEDKIKDLYLSIVFVGTIIFFVLTFLIDILVIKIA